MLIILCSSTPSNPSTTTFLITLHNCSQLEFARHNYTGEQLSLSLILFKLSMGRKTTTDIVQEEGKDKFSEWQHTPKTCCRFHFGAWALLRAFLTCCLPVVLGFLRNVLILGAWRGFPVLHLL